MSQPNKAPEWVRDGNLARLLFPADLEGFTHGLIIRAERWHVLDDAAWERVRVDFARRCVQQSLADAERVQPTPRPAYWDQVNAACAGVIAALDGAGYLNAAEWAAEAAMQEAEAVCARVWTEADRPAWTAVSAARDARWAARFVAGWPGSRSAWVVAGPSDFIAKALFAAIDAEIEAARAA